MSNGRDNDYISVGQWMLLVLLPGIPIIGWILVIILAFVGSNQTRKNYFRALIVWFLLVIAIIVVLGLTVGSFPLLVNYINKWQANHH